ncbi:HipA domain-containing protein [Pseudomonas sp. BT-42-2]|jgi:serine/threonine-protein kinase HipA|uniref:type II toxin-antitoxin system HipA family toxin n=1 Tax=Pseudomonas TaxID=286 RepID=UPI0021F7491D|nr:HipA domain-containing protein [Pseudomonas sp. BT-42-2]MCV9919016.1 HipA domain-containing protein [Pseudomonas sp. BT-42-2]
MADQLTLQVFIEGAWQDALTLTVENVNNVAAGACTTAYEHAYLIEHLECIGSGFEPAVSINQPLEWTLETAQGYPAFIYDIIPAGAARRSLERRFAQEKPDGMEMELFLLKRCTPAPVGHLRIKESFEQLDSTRDIAFQRQEVVDRTSDFLEYAYELGAAIGGATGAQGEAPKLLMTQDRQGGLHADAVLPDEHVHRHWLVKFARNKVTERDKNILRAEYHYYKAVAQLGMDTVPTDGLMLEEASKPSLWMPRFDRRVVDGRVERVPMESIYSVCGNTVPGSLMRHEDVLRRLVSLWKANGQDAQVADLIFEYIRRDLLNRILGNSDNHGRNMSIFREHGRLQLAPIYDLAPMVLDPEGVTRVTKWDSERKGAPGWEAVCASFADLLDPGQLAGRLKQAAEEFRALPGLLRELPEEVRAAQSIPLNNLDARLAEWGLR